jgi:hypothetical protein
MGETALDEDTYDQYLTEIGDHYTAEKVWSHSLSSRNMGPDGDFSITS